MKRLLYHNVEGAFNRADILRQKTASPWVSTTQGDGTP